jgi:rhamnogalacturonyl hydrolase YesR
MKKISFLQSLVVCSMLSIANTFTHAQGVDFGAFMRGAEEARRHNQADYEEAMRNREYERNKKVQIDRQNIISQYMQKFNDTRDFRYLYMASEMGNVEASSYLISSGIFCGRNGGNITCSK